MATSTFSTTSTSSFVTEVLASAGGLQKEDISMKLAKLGKRIEEVKVEVYDSLQKRYGDFYPNLNTAIELTGRVNTLSEDMDTVANRIEKEIKTQLNVSTAEFHDLSSQLDESNAIITILDKLMGINDALQESDRTLKNRDYIKAVRCLDTVRNHLEQPVNEREGEIKILKLLDEKHRIQQEKLMQDIYEKWSDMIKWSIPKDSGTDDKKKSKKKKKVEVYLVIAVDKESADVLKNMAQALYNLGWLDGKLKAFGEQFLEYFVKPMVTMDSTECVVTKEMDSIKVIIRTELDVDKQPDVKPTVAFSKVGDVLSVLNEHFLGISVKLEGTEGGKGSEVTLMRKLGDAISTDCLDLIVKQVLTHSVPSSNKELLQYNAIISITETFETKLVKHGFLLKSDTTLSDFVNNVNVLFANKQSQQILEKARALMTSEIHNMVKVTDEAPFGQVAPLELEGSSAKKAKTFENIMLTCDTKLSASTFKLPSCYISTAVQSLIQLTYSTLHEASTDSSPQCAIQLFYSVRNVFEMFCDVVPTYHKDSLINLPQLTAIHHNNCMYIAHHLLTLGHQFRSSLPEPLAQGAATFVDLVPKMRRLGTECFLQQMTRQRTQLLEAVSGASGFTSVSEVDNFLSGERAMKQMLHQLNHLTKVWHEVLPHSVYCKAMGTLLNSAITEVINQIVALEDISADDASQLHSLLSIIANKAPELFPTDDPESSSLALLHSYTQKWMKFKELMLILNASLQDIADRWADGKGPLAHECSANEVKQLIRALFQNTDRRAAVLSKIR